MNAVTAGLLSTELPPITDGCALSLELRGLVARAERGGVDLQLIKLLIDCDQRIRQALTRDIPCPTLEQRHAMRVDYERPAIAAWGELRVVVRVMDMGGRGFGLLGEIPIPSGSFIILELANSEDGATEALSCIVVFCREKEQKYRMGLRVLSRLPVE